MKKMFKLFVMLFTITLLCTSCLLENAAECDEDITTFYVHKAIAINDSYSAYSIRTSNKNSTAHNNSFTVFDKSGKYNVGDTLILIKKTDYDSKSESQR